MKTTRHILALLSATAVLSSCIEENFENTIKVNRGDEIVFGALAGFENNAPDTKTIYTGDYYYIGADGKVSENASTGARKFEIVHWKANDKVLIHCDQGEQTAHYVVSTGNATGSGLERIQLQGVANNAIQWNDITKNDHNFYAVYPSPYQFSAPVEDNQLIAASGYQNRIKVNNGFLECYLPSSQAPISIREKDGLIVAEPNMDFAYMIARNRIQANQDAQVPTSVELNFRPIVTALEITMTFPSFDGNFQYTGEDGKQYTVTGYNDIQLTNVQISSRDNSPIVGSFSMNLNDYTHNESADGYPEVTYDKTSIENSFVSVQMWDADGKPTTITSGGSIKFTVFLLPTVIEDNLKISVMANGVIKSADLGMTIEAHKKQYITNLVLPATPTVEGVKAEGSNWVSQLDPATFLGGLSIPGTANSFSNNYSTASDADYYKTQTISFEDQWNLGVRCFELVTDRCGTETSAGSADDDFANQSLRCNNKPLGLTVKEAFDLIIEKVLSKKGEFAMIIMTYQPRGYYNNRQMADRDPVAYMNELKEFYTSYRYKETEISLEDLTTIYRPGLQVGELKDKPIMLVARPSQEGEDKATDIDAASAEGYKILTVKGWGSLTDKWPKRGYVDSKGNEVMMFKGRKTDSSGQYGDAYDLQRPDATAVEDWIFGGSNTPEGDMPGISSPNFTYPSDQGFSVWAQEWRRIAESAQTYSYQFGGIFGLGATRVTANWRESYTEKKSNIEDCLKKSIAQEGNRVYFNSLDGFYIINDGLSCGYYWRGNMGNIGGYASDINEWFFPILQQYSAADVTGPLGVIIMDRVSNVPGSAGQLLLQTIYQNNFMFNIPKDPNYTPAS